MCKSVFLVLLILITGCSIISVEKEYKFKSEDISCNDISSSELKNEVKNWDRKPFDDLYFTAHVDEIMQARKKLANQGNKEAIRNFGYEKYSWTMLLNRGSLEEKYAQENLKADLVEGMTYIYIADAIIPNDENTRFNKDKIEDNKGSLKVPTKWILEAKANVQEWQEYCKLHK